MRNVKAKMIKEILPDEPTVDDIVELIETGVFGVSLNGIEDSERDSIWDTDNETIIEIFNEENLWDKCFELGDTIMESMKITLCKRIDLYQVIEDELYIYEDMIYQSLECMTIKDLKDLLEMI